MLTHKFFYNSRGLKLFHALSPEKLKAVVSLRCKILSISHRVVGFIVHVIICCELFSVFFFSPQLPIEKENSDILSMQVHALYRGSRHVRIVLVASAAVLGAPSLVCHPPCLLVKFDSAL